jgi:hypothetical protein
MMTTPVCAQHCLVVRDENLPAALHIGDHSFTGERDFSFILCLCIDLLDISETFTRAGINTSSSA